MSLVGNIGDHEYIRELEEKIATLRAALERAQTNLKLAQAADNAWAKSMEDRLDAANALLKEAREIIEAYQRDDVSGYLLKRVAGFLGEEP
jgi:hypothetical protein